MQDEDPRRELQAGGPNEGGNPRTSRDEGRPTEGSVLAGTDPGAGGPESAAASGQHYTVEDGDTLQSLAARFYGSSQEWQRIYEANTDRLSNPDLVYPGQELVIPAARDGRS